MYLSRRLLLVLALLGTGAVVLAQVEILGYWWENPLPRQETPADDEQTHPDPDEGGHEEDRDEQGQEGEEKCEGERALGGPLDVDHPLVLSGWKPPAVEAAVDRGRLYAELRSSASPASPVISRFSNAFLSRRPIRNSSDR